MAGHRHTKRDRNICAQSRARPCGHHASPATLGNQDGPLEEGIPFAPLPALNWGITDRLCARLGASTAVHRRLQAGCITDTIHRAADRYGLDAVIMKETKGRAADVARRASVPLIANLHEP